MRQLHHRTPKDRTGSAGHSGASWKEIIAFEAALQQHKDDPASDLPQEAQKMVGQTKVKAEFADEIEQLVLPKFCLKIPRHPNAQ